MTPELDKKLCEKYPEIFTDRQGDMRTTAMCWGFEHGDGWYQIIDALCAAMQSHYNFNAQYREKIGKPIYQPKATQVKEKFGTLRFYYNGGNDYTDGIVRLAEVLSGVTCENCGQPGERRTNRGWLSTLCEVCHNERKD